MMRLDWTKPQHCRDCGRPLRKAGAPLSEHPGTAQHRMDRLCAACVQYRRRHPNGPGTRAREHAPRIDWTKPQHCTQCGRRLRPRSATFADYPDTIRYGSKNQCDTCYTADREHDRPADRGHALTATVAALDRYITDRRKRGIPRDGLRPERSRRYLMVTVKRDGRENSDVEHKAAHRLYWYAKRRGVTYDPLSVITTWDDNGDLTAYVRITK